MTQRLATPAGRIQGLFSPASRNGGFAGGIKQLAYPGEQRALDILANSKLTGDQQRAIHGYIMRGVRQAQVMGYDLGALMKPDLSQSDFDLMPYPMKRAYLWMTTALSIDGFNATRTMQMHVGFLLQNAGKGNQEQVVGNRSRNNRAEVREQGLDMMGG